MLIEKQSQKIHLCVSEKWTHKEKLVPPFNNASNLVCQKSANYVSLNTMRLSIFFAAQCLKQSFTELIQNFMLILMVQTDFHE